MNKDIKKPKYMYSIKLRDAKHIILLLQSLQTESAYMRLYIEFLQINL